MPISDVTNGTLTLNTNGTFSYTPNAGYTGTDTFVYEMSDVAGASSGFPQMANYLDSLQAVTAFTVRANPNENSAPTSSAGAAGEEREQEFSQTVEDAPTSPAGAAGEEGEQKFTK